MRARRAPRRRCRPSRFAWAAALLLLAACESGSGTIATRGELAVSAQRLDFGDVPVLNTGIQELELRNLGRAGLVVHQLAIVEPDAPFSLGEVPATLGPGAVERLAIRFRPERLEAFAATLVLRTDDEDSPIVEIPLTGRGFTQARMEAGPALAFDRTCEGGDEVQRLRLASTGTAALVIEGLRFKEGTASEFQFVGSTATPATIPVGEALSLPVRFSPTETSPAFATGAILVTSTDPELRELELPLTGTVNRAPRPVIGELPNSAPGATVLFDGSATSDPEGELPLSWAWTLKSSPPGSRSRPEPDDEAVAVLVLDLPGAYTVQLVARDASGCGSRPAFQQVTAVAAQQLRLELVWDNYDADLDLHLVPEGAEFFGPLDCYFGEGHMRPDWGVQGDPSDDPSLDRDALTGFGPEIIGYPAPAPGRYRAMVHYYSQHRSTTPATTATLRVYQFGVMRSERRLLLEREGQRWIAVSIDWPGGAVTPIDLLEDSS